MAMSQEKAMDSHGSRWERFTKGWQGQRWGRNCGISSDKAAWSIAIKVKS